MSVEARRREIAASAAAEEMVRDLLGMLGEDPARPGLRETPARVRQSLSDLTRGYDRDPESALRDAIFEEAYDEMVLVRDIEFYSLCEHHLLPFFGKAHVAYIPQGRVIGLSKLPEIVDIFSQRLQVQERLTTEIADALWGGLKPRGVGVIMEASHLCMMMRGIEKQHSRAVTSCMRGSFKADPRTRGEFLSLVGQPPR